MHRRVTLGAALLALALPACGGDEPPPRAPERPPVVVLIFDELPTDVLLRPDGSIDAERFPNFAALARMSTWYPNATTVFDSTFGAVPAILDARLPRPKEAADVRTHQPSVFNLMDRLGYGIVKAESATAVCPPRICVGARARRPSVLDRLAGGGRPERLHRWVGAIRRRSRPTFYFHHTLLPHEPWVYLPSGRRNRPAGKDPIGSINRWVGFHDPWLSRHNHMRHLLQVGYVDRELGRLLRRLRRTRLLHRALLVVAADHGYSFQVGARSRRKVSETNIEEVAPVPFFVKTPGQRRGAVDDSLIRTIDIVPTVADVLGVSMGWRAAGRPASAAAVRERTEACLRARDFGGRFCIERDDLVSQRRAVREARSDLFLTGAESRRRFGDPWAAVHRVGTRPDLLGRRLASLPVRRAGGPTVELADTGVEEVVDPSSELLPTRVTGQLSGGTPREVRDLAVAVNGRIQATGRSFRLRFRPAENFSFVVPEEALRRGANEVQVLEVRAGGVLVPLQNTR